MHRHHKTLPVTHTLIHFYTYQQDTPFEYNVIRLPVKYTHCPCQTPKLSLFISMDVKLPPLSHCPLSCVENDQARWSIFTKTLLTSSPLAFVDHESSIRLVQRLSVLFCLLATICAVFHLWHAAMMYFLRCQRHLAFSIATLTVKP